MIGNEPVWIEVNCEGESGIKYFGRFRIKKYLTHKERAESVRVAEVLSRGITQDLNFRTLLATIAFVNQHILETDATWWQGDEGMKGADMIDENPIWEMASQISKAQKPPAPETTEEK